MAQASGRIRYIDVARGLSIICIVLGHLGHYGIDSVVFTFNVPIFFLITGYFFRPEDSWKRFLGKKAKTLLLPYVVTCLIVALISAFNDAVIYHGTNPLNTFWQWIRAMFYGAGDPTPRLWDVPQVGALWFLLASFWGCLLLRLVLMLKPWMRIPLVIGIFAAGNLTRFLWYPFSIQAGAVALLFMYIGYLFSRVKEKTETFPAEVKAAFLVLCMGVMWCFCQDSQMFRLVRADVGRGSVDILASLCTCWVVIMLSRGIDRFVRPLAKPLEWMGKYSILVLCFHLIELSCFPWWMVLDKFQSWGMPETLRLPVNVLLKFVWIIPMAILCANVNPLRRLFGLNPKKPKNQ